MQPLRVLIPGTNGDCEQPSPPLFVSASLRTGSSFSSTERTRANVPNASAFDVPHGANPLLLFRPRFTSVAVSDSTTLPAADNEIFVSFRANFVIQPNSILRIRGLVGSSEQFSSSIRIFATGQPFFRSGRWAHPELRVTTSSPIMPGNVAHFSFVLANPTAPQPAVSPTLSCDRCSVDPDAPVGAAASTMGSVLAVAIDPPACSDSEPGSDPGPRFGPDCSQTCFGFVNGPFCDCPRGRFGHDCGQTAEASPSDSTLPRSVSAGSSGGVRAFSGAGVTIGEGATSEDMVVSATGFRVTPTFGAEEAELRPLPGSLVLELRPENAQFVAPVRITLPINVRDVDAEEAAGRTVQVAFFNTTSRRWEVQGGAIDRAARQISVESNHFSLWTPVVIPTAAPPPGSGGGDDAPGAADDDEAPRKIWHMSVAAFTVLMVCFGVLFLYMAFYFLPSAFCRTQTPWLSSPAPPAAALAKGAPAPLATNAAPPFVPTPAMLAPPPPERPVLLLDGVAPDEARDAERHVDKAVRSGGGEGLQRGLAAAALLEPARNPEPLPRTAHASPPRMTQLPGGRRIFIAGFEPTPQAAPVPVPVPAAGPGPRGVSATVGYASGKKVKQQIEPASAAAARSGPPVRIEQFRLRM